MHDNNRKVATGQYKNRIVLSINSFYNKIFIDRFGRECQVSLRDDGEGRV